MNYIDSIKYLNSFTNLERLQNPMQVPAWNVERVRYLMKTFQHPEKRFFPVLIAGTKGKGSTGYFLESILEAAGIRTGFYSSPHLETPLERIRLGGKMISTALWTQGLAEIRSALRKNPMPEKLGPLTYFEIMTFLAILIFVRAKVKIGIFEAGMGGRLDAVNALDAKLSIITTIGLDHEAFLGNTIEKIAREKAGIIREGAYIVAASKPLAAHRVIRSVAKQKKAVMHGPTVLSRSIRIGLKGDFQRLNAGLAVSAAKLLQEKFAYKIAESAIRKGLRANSWPARMELTGKFLLDGAHNPAAACALTAALKKDFPNREAVLIFGCARDKRSREMLRTFSDYFKSVVLTRSVSSRSQDLHILMEESRGLFRRVVPAFDVKEAVETAKDLAGNRGLIVVSGSFYVAGEARHLLVRKRRSYAKN